MALDRLLQSVPLPNEPGKSYGMSARDSWNGRVQRCQHEQLEVHTGKNGGDYYIQCSRCPKQWKDFAVLVADRSR